MERCGIPGTFIAWPDVLHEGPTPLTTGDEWIQVRSAYLASGGYPSLDEILDRYHKVDADLESYADHEEVVFWFEHDLFDQLLLIRHLWWLGARGATAATRFSLVCGDQYLGLLREDGFPPLFEARRPITAEQTAIGTRAWQAFTAADPSGLLPLASADHPGLPFLRAALRRHLEEFPAAANGLARSERQILQVLSEGLRTPEEAFVEAARLEDHIFMGDSSFWTIVRRLAEGPRPLVAAHVELRPGRLPSGTLALTADGAAVLAGRADHVALNGIDRWRGGVRLTSERVWRWNPGSSTLKFSPSRLPPAS